MMILLDGFTKVHLEVNMNVSFHDNSLNNWKKSLSITKVIRRAGGRVERKFDPSYLSTACF